MSASRSEEPSLWDFVDPLLGSWLQITIVALAGAGVAFTLASLRTPVYEATAVVRIAGDQIDTVRTASLRPLLENRTNAGQLIRELGITSEPAWTFFGGSSPVAADTFFEDHGSVEQIAANLLRIRVRLGHADLAAKVANGLVERANALNRASQKDVLDRLDSMKARVDEAGKRLETLKSGVIALDQKSPTLAELQTAIEYERALLAHLDLSTRYEDERIRTGNIGAQFQLVDPALSPSAPVSPRVMLTTQLGGLLALLIGCLVVLGRHFRYRHRLT